MLGQLRVVHVAEDVARIAGGVPAVVHQLSERLSRNGIPVQIVHATGDPGELPPGVEVFTFPPTGLGRLWSWGRGLRGGVARLAEASNGDAPVFHVHGAWSAPQYFAARTAHQAGVPFVFTAHGMLEPWLWDQQGWKIRAKKRVYWSALAYPSLSKASVIHAITPLEQKHLARLFPNNRIEVIPNAIDMSDTEECPQDERCKTILFLGRIEPKKGVDVLLRAFASAQISKEWSIDVVGPAWSQAYLSVLKSIVDECELGERVRFRGPLFGEEKRKLIDTAWVLTAPSHSEVVGLVNLEAAARCLPSITTRQTGLYDWEQGGGILIEPNDDDLCRALEATCSWSAQEQRDRGLASRRLVQQRYSWQVVMPMWIQLYSSL
ncbi:MAG TPA: glycosyltransferase [Gallionella sp.]|nr:glycosyltransferase [Gallionella sp.]